MANDLHIEKLKAASPLGKEAAYESSYNPNLLFFIPRTIKRKEIGINNILPFTGVDIWNAYELSWLNDKGKPMVAIATIEVPADSENIFESKSLKLYLISFNAMQFTNKDQLEKIISEDLSKGTKTSIKIKISLVQEIHNFQTNCRLPGINIDHLDIAINTYQPDPSFLTTENSATQHSEIEEELNSDLLKSNCLVTNQPDWGSIYIHYQGKKINHAGLLKYIISLREHNEFHEQCVERIFMNILKRCQPKELTVYARYTRRGGIDINPFRTTEINYQLNNDRLLRQ